MGSITKYKGRWRAQVYCKGVRASKVLRTRQEALQWAERKERELAGGNDLLFEVAAERWLAWKLPQLDDNNVVTVEGSIRQHVIPKLQGRKLGDISRTELVEVVRAVQTQGKLETAHRVGQRIRAIFDYAVDCGEIQSHPAAGLSRVLSPHQPRPMRAIPVDQFPALLKAIQTYPEPVTRIGLMLLAHTFVRTSELIGARWSEIDGDTWVIPGERMKRGLPHVVPLSPSVFALLRELAQLTGDGAFLLQSTNKRFHLSKNTLLFALYRLGYRGLMTGHGFRSLASSILNQSSLYKPDVIERQLAHSESDAVRASYHRADYLPERRQMMAWYSQHLDDLARCKSS